ncbi:MAG: YdeI/OmpD-associated family protein [Actinomycetota bacterium]|nr:YdeI/OmpD-associated family protein [Actinomycetota bacterium]
MTAQKPAPRKVEAPELAFATAADFETWLAAHRHDSAGLWLRLAKKGSGIESVSYPEAVQVALCYGWIDGQARSGDDDKTWKQSFRPRRPRSAWSKRNVGYVAALTQAGRMQPEGLAEVERAKADGRWARAYDGPASAEVPEDLQAALDAIPVAARSFAGLSSSRRYAIIRQVQDAKRPETRARRITKFVEMLAEGRTP